MVPRRNTGVAQRLVLRRPEAASRPSGRVVTIFRVGDPCFPRHGYFCANEQPAYSGIPAFRLQGLQLYERRELIMESVVITGASTGIGWATAKLLLDRGFRVFGSVRKRADADRLKGEFGANFTPLMFDVTDEAAVLAAAREVRVALGGEKLAGLVNNAGISVAGP